MPQGGAYINGRYVSADKIKKQSGGNGRATGWSGEGDQTERKPGDEDTRLERKFDIDILQPGESRVGYMFNLKQTLHYDENGRKLTGMLLYFLARDGSTFRCTFLYRPYFFVQLKASSKVEELRDILSQRFAEHGVFAEVVKKEDLSLEDHLVGKQRQMIKLSFENDTGSQKARKDLFQEMRRHKKTDQFSFDSGTKAPTSAMASLEVLYEHDVTYVNRVCIDNKINCGKWFDVTRKQLATSDADIWDTQTTVTATGLEEKAALRIFAWDIECTKEPLKFPDSAHDRITLISAMVDGTGFLIVNRAEVSEDIDSVEYTPKPEYESVFQTYNEPDEAALLKRFFRLLQDTNPHVMVSFNGDFFDCPFVVNRCKAYNMDWEVETGVTKTADDYYCGQWIVHIDCFCWVQRDSYLPCGARGLKAVTRNKLKYDPVELDPEDMTPFAKDRPQELAAYSVSDAVATYFLYMKYIHDFIFALCSIIPYGPDDVLRKGSGTLCESLLMNQAFHANVIFPNKHHDEPLVFHEETNRLIEQSTYEGARVECMRVGVYRADIKETFELEPTAFQVLLDDLKETVDFFLVEESHVKIEDVDNYQEMVDSIEKMLRDLCDPSKVQAQLGREATGSPATKASQEEDYNLKLVEYEVVEVVQGVKTGGKKVKHATYRVIKDDFPLIYHLDVGAMYPNIILSNRLQPSAIVSKEVCAACSYNDPANNCKRTMDWKWRGELYMATKADVKAIMNGMENEKKRYDQKDRDTGEKRRVAWRELREAEQIEEITKAVREFSQKAYRRVKTSYYEHKTDVVCQRENPFYVNTVLAFRDRRYVYKAKVKEWTKNFAKAEEGGDMIKKLDCKDKMLLYDSLQLAHKCILNSFYGYVMRKGARWHSMKMAGIVTYTGSNLIREAREFVEMVGLPIELDTDGIWCMLPKSFPDTFKFKCKNGKTLELPYPNTVLNYRVHKKYTNHQYQEQNDKGEWKIRSENSIFFEIDGPYKAMVLPASTEEDKLLKKRYCVYEFDGSIAELKGFEMKRRGELKLIQVFQQEVFPEFLKGTTKEEVYSIVGAMANRWLDVIESKGRTMTDDEVVHFFGESKSMSKSVEASGTYKSVQITCARRLADFLGSESFLKDSGINCHMLVANRPFGASCTERAVPVKIFFAEHDVKKHWLRLWLKDASLTDFNMRSIIDWAYYRERLCAVFQKLISIPASYQKISNPCPRVKVPEWLRKRVAEQTDRFQQRSLGLYLKKKEPADAFGRDADASKRKLCDIEDLAFGKVAGNRAQVLELPIVEFGKGPRRWLQAHKLRWAADERGVVATAARAGWRASLFDDGLAWAQVAPDALRASWHIVSVEPAASIRTAASLRPGDRVVVHPEVGEAHEEHVEPQQGHIIGFRGGHVRVALGSGKECQVKRSNVRPLEEEGLYALWVATGEGLAMHRCEVLAKRRVVLALDATFKPEEVRGELQPQDLVKGLRVWPLEKNEVRVGPGVIVEAAPEAGLCQVKWATGESDVVFSHDLERQTGSIRAVTRDAPRNMQHGCLVELELDEGDFQRQRGEGTLGDADSSWPRVEAVYEAEQPLLFDLISQVGSTVSIVSPDSVDETRGKALRLSPEDFQHAAKQEYLPGLAASRNLYLYLCFDTAQPTRAFCGLFAPTSAEAWACFSGLDLAQGAAMKAELESLLSDQLSALHAGAALGVRGEVSFASEKTVGALLQWLDKLLTEIRRRDGGFLCVLSSQLTIGELRGTAPSSWVDRRHSRNLSALRELPVCCAPFAEKDAHYPTLDWHRWILQKFTGRMPQMFNWWRERLALCRAAGAPICNVPSMRAAMVPHALDLLFARQLRKDSQLLWASASSRPDLGGGTFTLLDAQEESTEAIDWILRGQHAEANNSGQINKPGIYRSICIEVGLRSKVCVCALQHARAISDMEGGELSKKMIRRVDNGTVLKNTDHQSEVSLTNFEALVAMAQSLAEALATKASAISVLRNHWLTQSGSGTANNIPFDDDVSFVTEMKLNGCDDPKLAARLEELRADYDAQSRLLDGLYGWLASPSSLFHDPALLRKVHQYMDKVLQLLSRELQQSGCEIVHASYNKLLFATGKYRMMPDVPLFWETLCDNIQQMKILQPLALCQTSVSEIFYGLSWMDTANWNGIPIDQETGATVWKVRSSWKMAEFLPPAVRPSLVLYATEMLLGPQRELDRQVSQAAVSSALGLEADGCKADAALPQGGAMEVDEDAKSDDADVDIDGEEDCDEGICGATVEEVDEDMLSKVEALPVKGDEILKAVHAFTRDEFFEGLQAKVMSYLDSIQKQQQREVPNGIESRRREYDGATSDEDFAADDGERERAHNADKRKRHLEEKWTFPEIPGRRSSPGPVEFEFMRTLVQIFKLEESLAEHVIELRDRMCRKLNRSSFAPGISFESPCFPLILPDVCCPTCGTSTHLDVTSHPARAPGLWMCLSCRCDYNKDAMEARLVSLLEDVVQAWQSQDIVCKKCRSLQKTQIQNFCECYGRFRMRFQSSDFEMVLRVMRSLTTMHDLQWLGEMIDIHEQLM